MNETPTPRWLRDLERLLPIRAQFVISGAIRDSVLLPLPQGPTLVPMLRGLWESLHALGFDFLLVYDPVDGVRVYPAEPAARELATRLFDLKLQEGGMPVSLESLAGLMRRVATQREARCGIVVDFASRLPRQPDHLSEGEHAFFVAAERLSLSAAPVLPKGRAGRALFQPVIWLLNRPRDLPSWFQLDSERIAALTIAPPDQDTRRAAARLLAPVFPGFDPANATMQEGFARRMADASDGLSLAALSDIAQLADAQAIDIARCDDAVQCYKLGIIDSPWKKAHLREKIAGAAPFIEERVKGQHTAVNRTLDILMRSVMGLTGAQNRSGGNRPRGVLFFAGPTGVGKTELAKTLTQLIFGDEQAYIRFDMSEFAEEHTSARLLGAPPGYIGFDAGGELTNAVRERPFSVILFDEIEKAHPRILDKFLQILEDGRLTDGRGETAYFSEAVIVFTSNLGIYIEDAEGRRVQNVRPGDPCEVVEARVREAIADHFKFHLSRPEILNRIGDNIVVFNFITPDVARAILDGMLANICARVGHEQRVTLTLAPAVREHLLELCRRDLSNGGRGIGNLLESAFINPLSRALFLGQGQGRTQLTVSAITEEERVFRVELQ